MNAGWCRRALPSLPRPGWVLAAVLLALGLNLLKLEVVAGARVFLGAFVTMPCLLVLPAPWGGLAAALAFAPTVPMLGHPFALLLGIAEAAWLTVAVGRLRRNLVLADAAFWLLAGWPLAWVMFCHVARLPAELAWTVVAKQAVTQLAAAGTGWFIVQLRRAFGGTADKPQGLREGVFNSLVVLTAVPLALVGLGFSLLAQQVATTEERTRMLHVTRAASRQVEVFLTLHQAALISAARVIEQDPAQGARLMEELRRAHPALITLLVADAAGRIVRTAPADALPRLRGSSVADRDYFRVAREHDRPFVSGVFRGRGFGHDLLVALSVPLHDADGRFAGIVQGSLEIERFGRMALETREPEAQMILADATGRVIYADAATGLRPMENLRGTALHALLTHPTTEPLAHDVAAPGRRMRRVHSYAARCEPFGMVVIAQWPVLAPWPQLRQNYALIGVIFAGVLGGALLVARAARRRLAEPLEAFAHGAEAQAHEGHAAEIARPPGPLPREIALVFDAFNRLARRLGASHAELRQANAELDRRVEERTAEAEAARRQAEAASRAKSEFIAMASHEIRTPLNAILGLTDAEPPASDAAVARERLELIRGAGERLLGVVNDLLDLSRAEAGRLELRLAPTSLAALRRETVGLLAVLARRQGLALGWEVGPGVPTWIRADAAKLTQVLVNLLGNALKFTREGGVRLKIDRTSAGSRGLRLRFAVSDTGPGIPPEARARLFQPFTQLPDVASSPVPGSGLGLMISRQLVELLGGELQVRSEVGRGAEFFFELDVEPLNPPGPADRPAPPKPALAAGTRGGWRLLVADDNFANQEVLRLMLETRCAQLEMVDTGAAALDRLRGAQFDAALIDLDMPDLDGFAVVRQWRADPAAGRSPCRLLAVSAHRRSECWAECAAAGFDAFVEKPIERAALFRELELVGQPRPA
ncbi:hybrid sensor histidine kinase/response regulator [Opitutus terrae]|uniref:histidine kinase n=1 Tax=Opitutus terrae (strain DSM 11246 / JCM 15787 / PB90-1) TaxID=452637 RepID=B1ZQY9_OPITP|nr:ATP-binding protein [Opitutus terrae]ACB73656.1 integral membrane sensor hybrid histidine kinase [Opitutus terrae PB90-1]